MYDGLHNRRDLARYSWTLHTLNTTWFVRIWRRGYDLGMDCCGKLFAYVCSANDHMHELKHESCSCWYIYVYIDYLLLQRGYRCFRREIQWLATTWRRYYLGILPSISNSKEERNGGEEIEGSRRRQTKSCCRWSRTRKWLQTRMMISKLFNYFIFSFSLKVNLIIIQIIFSLFKG